MVFSSPALETLSLDESPESKLDAINVELLAMGGNPLLYRSLPEGTMDVVEFKKRFAQLQGLRLEEAHAVKKRGRGVDLEYERLLEEQRKSALISFLENTKPIDAQAFLERKRVLLDKKLELLETSASLCLSYIF